MATAFVLVIVLGRKIGREKDRQALDYLTVRLQHLRDEFPFVVLLFFFP
jgi:hypothetical protein